MNAQILGNGGVYPVLTGQRQALVLFGVGPTSYSQTTGDVISLPFGTYLDAVEPSMSVSKTYYVRAYPNATNTTRATWTLKWYVTATNAETANGIDLSAEKIQFLAFGGGF